MGTSSVDFLTMLAFWCYVFGTFVELGLVFAFLWDKSDDSAAENADSEDVQLDLESNNELGNKITTYKSMKSGKPTPQTNPANAGYTANQGMPGAQQGKVTELQPMTMTTPGYAKT